ncbi:MAG: pentapeptide repeat-containing protein [Chloroflexota bacterium]|nr:MAG: pentapeptide repeat-containing protein [Chloroflexota bacterium]
MKNFKSYRIREKISNWLTNQPFAFYLISALLVAIVVFTLNRLDTQFSFHDILVEGHGLLFDLIVFGIILSIYDTFRTKRERIQRYKEEIKDFSGWKEQEASIRVVSNIRRLGALGVHKIELTGSFLKGMDLQGLNISDSNIVDADFSNAKLTKADLSGCWGEYAKFDNSDLEYANMQGWFYAASFTGAKIRFANMNYCVLQLAGLDNADLSYSSLLSADLAGASVKGTRFYKTKINEYQRTQLQYNGATQEQLDEIEWIK